MRILPFLSFSLFLFSCQNAAFRGSTAHEVGVCRSKEEYVGANFMFMMDNSGSMKDADCPSGDPTDCGETEREKALLKAFDILTEAAVASELNEKSISTFTVAKFTPENRHLSLDEFENPVQHTLESRPENRDELASILEFNRRPKGDTPYLNALELGKRVLEEPSLQNERKNILIVVTDGEPTDRRPSLVRAMAKEVDAKIVTIRINYLNLSPEGRRTEHHRIISENYKNWALDDYESIDEYVDELLALADEISDSNVIEIKSVHDLERSFFEDIIKQTVPCLPGKD